MKRNVLTLTLALLVSLLLVLPVSAAGETVGYVIDDAGILSDAEIQKLEQDAKTVSQKYDFGVYLITVENFRTFVNSDDVFDGAVALYKQYDMGVGEERKGVLLLLSMKDRDFSLVAYSDYGNYVFDQTTREGMSDSFLDDFGYDDWYAGFADYISECDTVLAGGPDKVQSGISFRIGLIFLLPLIVALIVVKILGNKMKSVARAVEAAEYAGGGLELTDSYDRFTHATEVRRKRKEESSNSGTRSKSSGGFGGTSGKF